MSPDDLLTVRNISKSFTGVQALDDVSMSISEGEVSCLVGENGSGKSTLIKIISGVYERDEGEVVINGRSYDRLTPIDAISEGIQVIYQDFSLFPNLTVAENIAMNFELARRGRFVNWSEIYQVAEEALERIDLDLDLRQELGELSVADKQLVAISRALLQEARLIIMDEPTTTLTRKEVDTLFSIIQSLVDEGISVLFVSHKLEEVFAVSDRIMVLRDGKKVFDGEAEELTRKQLEQHMTGREVVESKIEPFDPSGEDPVLRVEELSKEEKFRDVSFELYSGEVLGITGLLGSGRTPLALALFGLRPADGGNVYVNGEPVRLQSVEDAIENRIGYVPEDRLEEGLLLPQTVKNNINICTIDQLRNGIGLLEPSRMDEQSKRWIEELDIQTPSPEVPVSSLSGGNQQRVVLAKWLASSMDIFVLNGPTVGVDVGSKEEIHRLIRDLANQGMGIIIISDDIPEVANNCNRILLMKQGQIAEEIDGSSITENELAPKLVEEADFAAS